MDRNIVKKILLITLILIITYPVFAQSSEKDIFRNDAIWFTEKTDEGCTDLFSLNEFDSSVVRNTSSIFNAYKTGKLGAVPELSDYYIELDNG